MTKIQDRNQTGGKIIETEQPHTVYQTSGAQQLEAEV